MRPLNAVCCSLSMVVALGCGKSAEETRVEQAQQGVAQVEKGAEAMAKGLEDLAKGLQGAAGDPNQKPVDPVGFRDLQATFGDIGGWEKGKPTGERMTSPVNYSLARVSYTKGEAEIEEEISDSAFNQMLLAPLSMFLKAGYERETDDGYEKSTKVGEYPGWEKWNSKDKEGELHALVNNRFIVQVRGRNVDSPAVLQQAMASTDLKKLAGLK